MRRISEWLRIARMLTIDRRPWIHVTFTSDGNGDDRIYIDGERWTGGPMTVSSYGKANRS